MSSSMHQAIHTHRSFVIARRCPQYKHCYVIICSLCISITVSSFICRATKQGWNSCTFPPFEGSLLFELPIILMVSCGIWRTHPFFFNLRRINRWPSSASRFSYASARCLISRECKWRCKKRDTQVVAFYI